MNQKQIAGFVGFWQNSPSTSSQCTLHWKFFAVSSVQAAHLTLRPWSANKQETLTGSPKSRVNIRVSSDHIICKVEQVPETLIFQFSRKTANAFSVSKTQTTYFVCQAMTNHLQKIKLCWVTMSKTHQRMHDSFLPLNRCCLFSKAIWDDGKNSKKAMLNYWIASGESTT